MQGHLSEMSQMRVSANDQRNGTLARGHQLSREHRSPGLGDQAIQCDQKMDLNPESRFFWALSGQLRCFPLANHISLRAACGSCGQVTGEGSG